MGSERGCAGSTHPATPRLTAAATLLGATTTTYYSLSLLTVSGCCIRYEHYMSQEWLMCVMYILCIYTPQFHAPGQHTWVLMQCGNVQVQSLGLCKLQSLELGPGSSSSSSNSGVGVRPTHLHSAYSAGTALTSAAITLSSTSDLSSRVMMSFSTSSALWPSVCIATRSREEAATWCGTGQGAGGGTGL